MQSAIHVLLLIICTSCFMTYMVTPTSLLSMISTHLTPPWKCDGTCSCFLSAHLAVISPCLFCTLPGSQDWLERLGALVAAVGAWAKWHGCDGQRCPTTPNNSKMWAIVDSPACRVDSDEGSQEGTLEPRSTKYYLGLVHSNHTHLYTWAHTTLGLYICTRTYVYRKCIISESAFGTMTPFWCSNLHGITEKEPLLCNLSKCTVHEAAKLTARYESCNLPTHPPTLGALWLRQNCRRVRNWWMMPGCTGAGDTDHRTFWLVMSCSASTTDINQITSSMSTYITLSDNKKLQDVRLLSTPFTELQPKVMRIPGSYNQQILQPADHLIRI